jgi:hypothetical protein
MLMQESDREKRTKMAYAIVEFMAQLAPAVKSTEDYRKKAYGIIFFLLADYQLDVDAPYDIAQREFIVPTPEPLPYPSVVKTNSEHYGKYIVEFIEQAKVQIRRAQKE